MENFGATWRTSSYSSDQGGACVECASAAWATSSHSSPNGQCVQIAELPATVAVRDSKHPHLGHLTVPRDAWTAFLSALRTGEL